jgi:hypothetical protein
VVTVNTVTVNAVVVNAVAVKPEVAVKDGIETDDSQKSTQDVEPTGCAGKTVTGLACWSKVGLQEYGQGTFFCFQHSPDNKKKTLCLSTMKKKCKKK